MKAIALGALALCSAATTAAADVVIYRATCRIDYDVEMDEVNAPPPKSTAFVIVDYDAGTWNRFHYYREGGKRLYVGRSDIAFNFRGGNAVLPSGKSASVFARGFAAEDPSGFSCNLTSLRGINVPIVTRTQPSNLSVTRPRAGSLILREFQGTAAGAVNFVERTYTLTLDPARTIKANNANQSLLDVSAALIDEFHAKGYLQDEN